MDRDADFHVGPFHVYTRPHLERFLSIAFLHYRVAIWSSATIDYVTGIASHIRPHQARWEFVWGRDRCTPRLDPERFDTIFIKDLRKTKRLGYDIRRTLIVDDTPAKVMRNYGNAIYVRPFEGDPDDELLTLLRYIEEIRNAGNYRSFEKRGWRTHRFSTSDGYQCDAPEPPIWAL